MPESLAGTPTSSLPEQAGDLDKNGDSLEVIVELTKKDHDEVEEVPASPAATPEIVDIDEMI